MHWATIFINVLSLNGQDGQEGQNGQNGQNGQDGQNDQKILKERRNVNKTNTLV